MQKNFSQFSMLIMAALSLSGCGPSPETLVKKLYEPSQDKDFTVSPEYNFASFSDSVWKTKVKVAIAETKRYTGAPEASLLAPQRFDPTHPRIIQDRTRE